MADIGEEGLGCILDAGNHDVPIRELDLANGQVVPCGSGFGLAGTEFEENRELLVDGAEFERHVGACCQAVDKESRVYIEILVDLVADLRRQVKDG